MATREVVIDITTASERPLLVVVIEDGGATTPPSLVMVGHVRSRPTVVESSTGDDGEKYD